MDREIQPSAAPHTAVSSPGIHIECPRCRSFTYVPQTQPTAATFDCQYCHHSCNTDTRGMAHR